jgi:hypothetical protein
MNKHNRNINYLNIEYIYINKPYTYFFFWSWVCDFVNVRNERIRDGVSGFFIIYVHFICVSPLFLVDLWNLKSSISISDTC